MHSWQTFAMPHRIWALGFALLAALAMAAPAGAEWFDLGGGGADVTLIESDGDRSVLEITIGGFEATPVVIDGETYYQITVDEGTVQQIAGMPALPDVRRSLIIPDDREMTVRLLAESHVDFAELPVAPSKGHLLRNVDPASVPYAFDAFYQGGEAYPTDVVTHDDPYILRDFRGMVVDVNAFQYLAGTRTLRVYTSVLVEVAPAGPARVNAFERTQPLDRMDTQFAGIYRNHFINFETDRYVPVTEDGDLLVICYDGFVPNMASFVEWKQQKGMATSLVAVSEIGSTATAIKAYIQNIYDSSNLGYVLLVGDAAQVPTFTSGGGGSDPTYSKLAGSDDYPDIFVGRFSAESPEHVDTQVLRTIRYERDADDHDGWAQYGTGIASDQGEGIGHYGESDITHENLIRDDLLAYGYVGVDQIYDPGATAGEVATAVNAGRGIINYTGHGSTTAWGTTGFSSSHVNSLTNDNMLPFICSVACVNGNFTSSTCFGEAWLRATNGGEPTGAIATYMSSINQSWAPPMDAQDEAVDLMIAEEMFTIGGLWYNGSCHMIDRNGAGGSSMFLTWHIFGDPSVMVRTKAPTTMTVNHPGTLILGQGDYTVSIPGHGGALCALYADGTIYGSAVTDAAGTAVITMDPAPEEPMNLLLTVTAYNSVTYQGTVEVVPAEGPYLLIGEVTYIEDAGDGIINAGESVSMRMKLRNVGVEDAIDISARITDSIEDVTLTVDTQTFPNIPAGGEAWSNGYFEFEVAPQCPDQTTCTLPIAIQGGERLDWDSDVTFMIHAPAISVSSVDIDDTVGGDGNLRLDPGESATVAITLLNAGSGALDEIGALFTCSHPMITVTQGSATHEGLGQDESGVLQPVFEISIDPLFPAYEGDFDLAVTGSYEYDQTFELRIPIGGFYETVESGSPDWTHYFVTDGFTDQWHISTQRNHSPNGASSWKCGDQGAGDYASLLDAALETPAVEVSEGAEVVFWMWIDAEESGAYPGRAYDGGLVEMSVDGGPFTQITPEGGYTHTIRTGSTPGPFPEDTPVFSGSADWQQVRFNLGDTAGNVALRFRFGTDGADTREGWFIDDIEIIGLVALAGVDDEPRASLHLSLEPSRPNPTAGASALSFALPQAGRASLEVFDANGRLVRTLVDGQLDAGAHHTEWRGTDNAGRPVASGLYYFRLSTPEGARRRTVVVLR